MKILYYNWVDYTDPENRGGGVTVYQKNLINGLNEKKDIDPIFLSSGISYDILSSKPRWATIKYGDLRDRERRFEIINSAVLSPSHFSFGNSAQIEHAETEAVFFDFLKVHGPFDAIHFNNLEGIPARVLDLKKRWPDTQVILSLHNYYPFCPQVNLWKRESEHCSDFNGGKSCQSCMVYKNNEHAVRLAGGVAFNLKKRALGPGTLVFNKGFATLVKVARRIVGLYGKLKRIQLPKNNSIEKMPNSAKVFRLSEHIEAPISPFPAEAFAARRQKFLKLINDNCDVVLGVSERVSKIARDYGVNPKLIHTAYIGTNQCHKFQETTPKRTLIEPGGIITLGYLGYMRKDKGYFFLMEALKALPKELAGQVSLVLAAPRGGTKDMEKLHDLSEHLHEVTYADGYTHEHLDELLQTVDLGVVPVLWEDNLPQVAIEMHVRHIPLLTSNLGGAQELGNFPDLVFSAGDIGEFGEIIRAALDDRIDLKAYWDGALSPISMEQHINTLTNLYWPDLDCEISTSK